MSAEVYGAFNKKGEFKPKVIPQLGIKAKRILLKKHQTFTHVEYCSVLYKGYTYSYGAIVAPLNVQPALAYLSELCIETGVRFIYEYPLAELQLALDEAKAWQENKTRMFEPVSSGTEG